MFSKNGDYFNSRFMKCKKCFFCYAFKHMEGMWKCSRNVNELYGVLWIYVDMPYILLPPTSFPPTWKHVRMRDKFRIKKIHEYAPYAHGISLRYRIPGIYAIDPCQSFYTLSLPPRGYPPRNIYKQIDMWRCVHNEPVKMFVCVCVCFCDFVCAFRRVTLRLKDIEPCSTKVAPNS